MKKLFVFMMSMSCLPMLAASRTVSNETVTDQQFYRNLSQIPGLYISHISTIPTFSEEDLIKAIHAVIAQQATHSRVTSSARSQPAPRKCNNKLKKPDNLQLNHIQAGLKSADTAIVNVATREAIIIIKNNLDYLSELWYYLEQKGISGEPAVEIVHWLRLIQRHSPSPQMKECALYLLEALLKNSPLKEVFDAIDAHISTLLELEDKPEEPKPDTSSSSSSTPAKKDNNPTPSPMPGSSTAPATQPTSWFGSAEVSTSTPTKKPKKTVTFSQEDRKQQADNLPSPTKMQPIPEEQEIANSIDDFNKLQDRLTSADTSIAQHATREAIELIKINSEDLTELWNYIERKEIMLEPKEEIIFWLGLISDHTSSKVAKEYAHELLDAFLKGDSLEKIFAKIYNQRFTK